MVRALLIAEAANPEWVSVPLVGWSMARAISRACPSHIVTQVRNREAFLRAGLREGDDFTAIDSETLMRPLWRVANALRGGAGVGWTTQTALNSLAYPYFERLVWQRFRADLAARRFDVVHRITPLTPTAPSSLAPRCAALGVPFVVGPLNGGIPWPREFDASRRAEREWLSYVRSVYKLMPGIRRTYRTATAVIAGSKHTLGELPAGVRDKAFYLPENGIDASRFSRVASPSGEGPLRLCFVGRLVPYKGVDMLLEAAVPLLQSGAARLDIVGDGPSMATARALVSQHGLEKAVTLHGWVEHARVQDVLGASEVLAFPSIREFGGGVVLEAMALGVVPLVVDYGGPGELVDPGVGFKVPMGQRADIVRGVREALHTVLQRRAELPRLAQASRQRVQSAFTWEVKAQQVLSVYDWALDRRQDKPAWAESGLHMQAR